MDDKIRESLCSLIDQIELTQTCVEQDVFNTLNQQDKVIRQFSKSTEKIMEFIAFMEGTLYQAAEMSQDLEDVQHGADASGGSSFYSELAMLLQLLIGQQSSMQEICISMQELMELQNESSDIIHRLESDVTEHRIILEELSRFL